MFEEVLQNYSIMSYKLRSKIVPKTLLNRSRNRSASCAAVAALRRSHLLAVPHPVDLGSLYGTTGFRLDGIDAADQSGLSVSSVDDVNGDWDGFDDLVIGARRAVGQRNESQVVSGGNFRVAATITGQHIFYNNSFFNFDSDPTTSPFDSGDPEANANDGPAAG